MESRGGDDNVCNGSKLSASEMDLDHGVDKEEEREEEDCGETESLLPARPKGGLAGRRERTGTRKVQWNDRNGNKLVEVLEFEPSDSSDSEDDSSYVFGYRADAVVGCIPFFCCLGSQRSRS